MFAEILRAFMFIFVAEMGDKTQILAMAFATKYSVKKVLLGIFIGSLLNHTIAVILGNSLNYLLDPNDLQIFAGFAFVVFALWSLKINEDEENNVKKVKYGPVITVAIAFFIGELGDKTQLTAIALAASSEFPFYILIGTVLGMVVTGGLGIFIGIKLGSKIPEFYIKIGAAFIFFFFGFFKLYDSLPNEYLQFEYIIPFLTSILVMSYFIIKPAIALRKTKSQSLMIATAEKLHCYYTDVYKQLEGICLGENICGKCDLSNCLVGYTKNIIEKASNGEITNLVYINNLENQKKFDYIKVTESLKLTINFLKADPTNNTYLHIHHARQNFETILLGTYIDKFIDLESYIDELIKIDKRIVKIMGF